VLLRHRVLVSHLSKIAVVMATIAIVIGLVAISLETTDEITISSEKRVFYINTVHVDGKTNINGDKMHPSEPFPSSPLPEGGGYVLTPPDEQGNWKVRAFEFSPSQLVVYRGDKVTLNFLDDQGSHHAISVEGHADEFELNRGELKTITFTADKVGTINFSCSLHQPTMQGQIIVLPQE